jgi:hypothetical protein
MQSDTVHTGNTSFGGAHFELLLQEKTEYGSGAIQRHRKRVLDFSFTGNIVLLTAKKCVLTVKNNDKTGKNRSERNFRSSEIQAIERKKVH